MIRMLASAFVRHMATCRELIQIQFMMTMNMLSGENLEKRDECKSEEKICHAFLFFFL